MFMRRKLVKQGQATLMVSLPAKWIRENKLNKGSEVIIKDIKENLIISAEEPENIKLETTIKLTHLTESSIRTLITNTYRKGYDKIKVLFNKKEQFAILNEVVKNKLIGFEITKKEKDYCIVENVTEPSIDLFENLTKKVFYNINEFFEVIEGKSSEDAEEIANRIQRYDNFCRRVVSKKKLTLENSTFFWTFLTLVLHGQRELYYLNKNKKAELSKENKVLLEKTKQLFNIIKDAYLKKSVDNLGEAHKLAKEEITNLGNKILKKGKEDALVAYYLMAASRQFYQANSPLTGLIL
jgi:phosphate uptake regulator